MSLVGNPVNSAYENNRIKEGMRSLSSIMNPSASQNASYQLERKRFLEGNAQAELNKAMSSLATSDVGKRLISDIFGYKESDGVDVSPLVSRMAFDPNFQQATAGVQNLSTGKQRQNAYEIMTAPETLPGLPGPDDTQRIGAATAYTNKYMPANTALTGPMRESMLETADQLARYKIDQGEITNRMGKSIDAANNILNFNVATQANELEDSRSRDFNEVKEERLLLGQNIDDAIEMAKIAGDQATVEKLGVLKIENEKFLGTLKQSIVGANNLLKASTDQNIQDSKNEVKKFEIGMDAANTGAKNLMDFQVATNEIETTDKRLRDLHSAKEARLQLKDSIDQAIQMANDAGDLELKRELETKKIANERYLGELDGSIKAANNLLKDSRERLKIQKDYEVNMDGNQKTLEAAEYRYDTEEDIAKYKHNNRTITLQAGPGETLIVDDVTGKKLNLPKNDKGQYILDGGPAETKPIKIEVGDKDVYLDKETATQLGVTKNAEGFYKLPGQVKLKDAFIPVPKNTNLVQVEQGEDGQPKLSTAYSNIPAEEPKFIQHDPTKNLITTNLETGEPEVKFQEQSQRFLVQISNHKPLIQQIIQQSR